MAFLDDLKRLGLVAIIRATSADAAVATADALFRGGVLALEVTYSTPDCCAAIKRIVAHAPAGAAIGVGTVRSVAELEAAVAAGATYAVSPHVDVELIAAARRLKVASLPGAFTASEVMTAWKAGATCIKLFPAVQAGPDYLRALRAPLSDIPFMPTGGIVLETIHEWFDAGAVAVGLSRLTVGTPAQVEEAARAVIRRFATISAARAGRAGA
jgi:2-dehydro-3-deoxyphosphogluconate aldolase / (4S)-4-hydroxy-2-oxoglutarate aldolase